MTRVPRGVWGGRRDTGVNEDLGKHPPSPWTTWPSRSFRFLTSDQSPHSSSCILSILPLFHSPPSLLLRTMLSTAKSKMFLLRSLSAPMSLHVITQNNRLIIFLLFRLLIDLQTIYCDTAGHYQNKNLTSPFCFI